MSKYNQIRKARLQIADAGCVITRNKSDIYHMLSVSQIHAMEAASLLIESIVSSLHDLEDEHIEK
jgi:signal recognition particle receptor subunit beta